MKAYILEAIRFLIEEIFIDEDQYFIKFIKDHFFVKIEDSEENAYLYHTKNQKEGILKNNTRNEESRELFKKNLGLKL